MERDLRESLQVSQELGLPGWEAAESGDEGKGPRIMA